MARKPDTAAHGSEDAGAGPPPAAITLDEARRLYDEGREPLAAIARRLGLSPARFRRLRLEQAWPERTAPPPAPPKRAGGSRRRPATREPASKEKASGEPVANSGAAPTNGEPAPADTRVLARRVEAAVRRELANVERRLRCDDAETAERNARVLASLVKSLVELGRLDTGRLDHGRLDPGRAGVAASAGGSGAYEDADNPAPPRELAELREELAAHLARIRGEREAGGGGSEPEPA